jgi:hypothetical protein
LAFFLGAAATCTEIWQAVFVGPKPFADFIIMNGGTIEVMKLVK